MKFHCNQIGKTRHKENQKKKQNKVALLLHIQIKHERESTTRERERERERELGDFLSTPRVMGSFEISLQILVTPLQLFVASSS
jgi:hypothetical protein